MKKKLALTGLWSVDALRLTFDYDVTVIRNKFSAICVEDIITVCTTNYKDHTKRMRV